MVKNKKIIRSVKELPQWYGIEKYRGIESLDAAQWYEILLQRWTHFAFFERDGVSEYKTDKLFYSVLLQSRENPFHLLKGDREIVLIGGGQLQALKYDEEDFATFSYAISPLTVRSLYKNERRLNDASRLRIRKWMDRLYDNFRLDDEFEAETEWARSFIDDPIFEAFEKEGKDRDFYETGRSHDLIQIDLSIPDKILIQQFTDYLRYIRHKYPDIKKAHKYKPPEYKKWIDYAVLPYIDLQLWAEEMACSIPNRVMADAIFPEGEKGEEMIRKTTRKISNTLMQQEYIDFLATIAAHEIEEKNLKKNFRKK